MSRGDVKLPALPTRTPVGRDAEADQNLTTAPEVPVDPYAPVAVTPWAQSTGTATIDATTAPGTTVPVSNGLPVAVGVPAGTDPTAIDGDWSVQLAAPTTSQDSGVSGLIMEVTPPADADPTAQVSLAVDTTGFADLYGPQAADRFGLELLPDCVMNAPDSGDCAAGGTTTMSGRPDPKAKPLPSKVTEVPAKKAPTKSKLAKKARTRKILTGSVPVRNLLGPNASRASHTSASKTSVRTASFRDSGDVLPAVDASGPQVIGAMDTGASTSGDYTATPLLSSGSWAAGSSSGAFTYSYDVQVPQTAGGVMPKVSLSYSSQSVDGRTSATNNQASWIGDGWDYNPGSISRTYANCRQDSKKPGANNATHRTADLCWGSNNATLSLGGMTTQLVWDKDQNKWFTANGDGAEVEQIKDPNTANGAKDGEYWVVTTRDGTKYYFGKNRLPGWSDGQPVTDSVLTVPVYGNHPGEPCYKDGDWANSWCTQGWRWNLDYVEDVHGNAMSLWWKKEKNYYARNFNFKAPVVYDRGGYLSHIDYGQRKDTLFTETAPARVGFTVAERCFDEGGVTCSDANFEDKDPGKYRIWYDTPADLNCKQVTSTYTRKCWNAGPSFWTRKRLVQIQTSAQRRTDTTARQVVDRYALKQSFPVLKTGPNTALWLESVQRTGYARNGSTDASVTLNPVRFEPNAEDMPNRVMRPNDPRPGFSRLRVARVINEYGGETVVTYKTPTGDCATGTNLPDKTDTAGLKNNTRLCYPMFWSPDPQDEDIDWFHKYVVDSIEELPDVDGELGTKTTYAYKNPGWKLSGSEFTKKSTRTYSTFAGFEQTTVITGADDQNIGSKRSKAVTRFFRGMGDTVSVKDITGTEIAKDRKPFAGRIAEELVYSSADDVDTDWLSRSVSVPAATELAHRDRDDGLSPLIAWRVTEPDEIAYTRSSGTGDDTRTERIVKTHTTYDSTYGLPVQVESLGDTGKSGDESCTKLEYLNRPDKNIIGLTKQALVSPTTCAAANFSDLSTLTGAIRTAYDGQAYGTALGSGTQGEATESWSLNSAGTGFQSNGTHEFDPVGRVVKATDPQGHSGTIAYSPSVGQVFSVTTTNALGQTQKQELEPGRSTTLKTTDANGNVSQATYDPLGRLSEAWAPGRTPSSSSVPDFRAVYTVPQYDPNDPSKTDHKPPYVTTYARGFDNHLDTSVTLYDGLGRQRQTQEQADGGGWLITDTLYNSSGEVWQTNNAYLADDVTPGKLFTPLADTAVPNITRYTYDGQGRVLQETPVLKVKDPTTGETVSQEVPEKATRYEYGSDWSKVIQPEGASSYRVWTDALGRTVRTDTFNPAAPDGYTSTRYAYDKAGQLVKATNSVDPTHPWTWSYDHRGHQITSTDPDTGTTKTTYDTLDRPLTTTNARGITVWNGYDALSRPTEQRLDNSTGTPLARFTYDTAPGGKGMPASAIRYTDGEAYTQQVDGYTKDYQPTSTTLTLPSTLASTWGLKSSYTYDYQYNDQGMPTETQLPAAGAFGSEKVVVRYNKDGKPLSVSGKDWYGAETVYDPYGQVLRSTLGAQPYRVWTQNSYDESTGELKDRSVYREQTGDKSVVGGNLVSHRSYTYDPAGNVTSIREHATGVAERQCFTYDPLGELKTAWTAKDQTSCTTPKLSDGTLNVAAGADNSGYWQEYKYDLLGNRTQLTEKDLTGNTAKDAVTTYSYGKSDGTQPRTLTKVSKHYTTPAGAQVTAEAERLYDLTGNTKSVTSVQNGDKQDLTWTYDGKIERIKGAGAGGKTPYVGLADKCLDLQSGKAAAGQPIQLYACNSTVAQSWRFSPAPGATQTDPDLGTLNVYDDWCVQPAGTTAGSAVQLQKCDGSAAQQLKRNASGQLTHVASGLCLAVKGADSANATPIVLATCDSTKAEQQWAAQNDTRYIYGPDGSTLLTVKGKQATLNLGDTEVTVAPGGVLINTQRTYSAPGGSVVRYAYGNGEDHLVALAGDHQGSAFVEVGLRDQMPVRMRKQDPFGNQRGTGTIGGNQQNHTGFLGATRDDASGFVGLGARLYDPSVGRFLSADPVLDLNDVLQSNGYAYADNNPVTMSDPSGLAISLSASERAAALLGAGLSEAQVAQAQAMQGKSLTSVILAVAWDTLKDFIGINDALSCFGGDMWSCVSVVANAIPWYKLGKLPKIIKAVKRTISAIKAFRKAEKEASRVLRLAKAAEKLALRAKKLVIERAKKKAAQRAEKKAAEEAKRISDEAVSHTKKTGNPRQKRAQSEAAPKSSSQHSGHKSGGSSEPGGKSGASSRSKGGSSGSGGEGKSGEHASDGSGESAGSCPVNSFAKGTKVLMADGTTKPIEQVKAGDKVVATDPRTGETRIEKVTAEIKGQGLKRLVTVTIDVDGKKGTKTAQVTATDGHPFWVPELGRWIKATDLRAGEWLRTSAGTHVQISKVERWTVLDTTVHNLTVSDVHTYYVLAGTTPVLVHNANSPIGCGVNGEPIYDIPAGSSGGAGAGKRIPPSLLKDYDVGKNAAPGTITPLCSYCRTNPATAIDHVEPRIGGGDLTDANTTPACTFCNSSKRDRLAPMNPPPNYTGSWPPPWWPSRMTPP
ncbi:ricin-type beta-trefoil lectin domain protein [Streptomyces beihaiensis]|uniref:Ricin-type beta-trefoil lectin domain protein n=1 Tax=Streptomyces beihaiensis TaxID=2984495 RepID=A0ABT3TZD4_9ACTN|nr:ricin-type beta-trefoil lectin domain protein [Streptomyces beihaiensis]MCX3062406.1 ricin-type beta-trefoil lectin domain protein [Streptomyces beihaiensis]